MHVGEKGPAEAWACGGSTGPGAPSWVQIMVLDLCVSDKPLASLSPIPAIGLTVPSHRLWDGVMCANTRAERHSVNSGCAPPLKPLPTHPENAQFVSLVSVILRLGSRGALPPAALLPRVPAGAQLALVCLCLSLSVLGCRRSTEGLSGSWPCLQSLAALRPTTSCSAVVCRCLRDRSLGLRPTLLPFQSSAKDGWAPPGMDGLLQGWGLTVQPRPVLLLHPFVSEGTHIRVLESLVVQSPLGMAQSEERLRFWQHRGALVLGGAQSPFFACWFLPP